MKKKNLLEKNLLKKKLIGKKKKPIERKKPI